MSADSTECELTMVEIQKDDPRLKLLTKTSDQEHQSSFVATIQLIPGSDRLEIEDPGGQLAWHDSGLTIEDFSALEALGLRGKLIASGCSRIGDEPFKSRTLIVASQQIEESVDLPQPNNCQVIYYQIKDEWRSFPVDAPLLKKRIRLSVDSSNQALFLIWVEAYFESGAGAGGGLLNWAN